MSDTGTVAILFDDVSPVMVGLPEPSCCTARGECCCLGSRIAMVADVLSAMVGTTGGEAEERGCGIGTGIFAVCLAIGISRSAFEEENFRFNRGRHLFDLLCG